MRRGPENGRLRNRFGREGKGLRRSGPEVGHRKALPSHQAHPTPAARAWPSALASEPPSLVQMLSAALERLRGGGARAYAMRDRTGSVRLRGDASSDGEQRS